MHRAFHALPPLTTPVGEPINAVYGLVSMLLRVIQDLKPTHIAFAFDRPEPTFRKEMFKEYQSHRPEMDDELSPQFAKAQEVIKAFGIPIYDKAGFEADDVIGTIADKCETDEVIVVTGDRDMIQLVNQKTKLYMPGKGLLSSTLYGEREAEEKMGVKPVRVVDLKGLIGDASDNYKGVPGIGPKTAQKLLNQFGSFDNIYKNLDKIPENVRQKLEMHKTSADMSYDLARIRKDVEVGFNLGNAANWRVDSTEVRRVFESFGFKTLAKRVKAVNEELQKQNQGVLL